MQIARVIGLVVSTVKHGGLQGRTLLLLEPADLADMSDSSGAVRSPGTTSYVATDHVGAGVGEVVLVTTGSAARTADPTVDVPTDAAVVAIVDTVVVESKAVFSKNG